MATILRRQRCRHDGCEPATKAVGGAMTSDEEGNHMRIRRPGTKAERKEWMVAGMTQQPTRRGRDVDGIVREREV